MADLTQNASDQQIDKFMTNLVNRTQFTKEDEKTFKGIFDQVIATPATEPVGLFAPGEATFRGDRFQQTTPTEFQDLSDAEIDRQIAELEGRQ